MATRKTATTKTAVRKPRAATASKPSAKAKTGNGAAPTVTMTLTHDQIARKAYEIWLAKGCPQGQDHVNWKEAEAALLSGKA